MKNKVLKTEEIFRVTFMDGDFERLMKQTYTNEVPFYYVSKGTHDLVPVDTSNSDLKVIEKNLKRFLRIDSTALQSQHVKNNPKVMEITKQVLGLQKDFLKKLQAYSKTEIQ